MTESNSYPESTGKAQAVALASRHLRVGWWSLLLFVTLGLALETLHGFKVGWYLNVANETRRLMWTLSHAHGNLLSLINMGFAATLFIMPESRTRWRRLVSPFLLAATILLPGGFFLGGTVIYSGDPGLGILLVPIGGLLLFVAVAVTAVGVSRSGTSG